MPSKGYKQTKQHRERISKSNKAKIFSLKHRKNISKSHKGKHYSPSTEFKKGLISNRKGKKFPQFSGENSFNWKGGIRKVTGYILLRNPGHPFCHKNGYVRRARIVMEHKIGRLLRPEEIVHHINKIRDDDRPKNLMLFASHHDHAIFHAKLTLSQQRSKQHLPDRLHRY